MRKMTWTTLGSAMALACSLALAAPAMVQFDIPAQRIDKALNSWADRTGYQVLVSLNEAAREVTAPAVKGLYTPEEALKELLGGSELRYRFVSERVVMVQDKDILTQRESMASSPGHVGEAKLEEKDLKVAQDSPQGSKAEAEVESREDKQKV